MQSLGSMGNKADAKNAGVVCAREQKVVNMNGNVAPEEEKPGLNPWWTPRAGILLVGFEPQWLRNPYSHGTPWDGCHKWDRLACLV